MARPSSPSWAHDHVEALDLEVHAEELEDHRVVVDDQHRQLAHTDDGTGATVPARRWGYDRRPSRPRSSGDRAPPSGGGCVGSNPTGGTFRAVSGPRPSRRIRSGLARRQAVSVGRWRRHLPGRRGNDRSSPGWSSPTAAPPAGEHSAGPVQRHLAVSATSLPAFARPDDHRHRCPPATPRMRNPSSPSPHLPPSARRHSAGDLEGPPSA